MDWFETWFDSPYYHLLYKHRDETEADILVNSIAEKYAISKFPKVLDAACGKGRHALSLAQKGYQVAGFDLAKNSIAEAQKLVSPKVDLTFKVHNILDPYAFDQFDLVTNLFTSFGYFETEIDDMRALRALNDALKPTGIFIQDYLNAELVQENETWQEQIIEGVLFKTKKEILDKKVVKHIKIEDGRKTFDFKESVVLFRQADFERLYKPVGLKIKHIFGDYHFNAFDEKISPRLLIISGK